MKSQKVIKNLLDIKCVTLFFFLLIFPYTLLSGNYIKLLLSVNDQTQSLIFTPDAIVIEAGSYQLTAFKTVKDGNILYKIPIEAFREILTQTFLPKQRSFTIYFEASGVQYEHFIVTNIEDFNWLAYTPDVSRDIFIATGDDGRISQFFF